MDNAYTLTPQGPLFFKDARPMEASDAGLGANWPRPDQLYHALRSSLLWAWPTAADWEVEFKAKGRLDSLRTMGPFPLKDGEVFLPCPLDWNMNVVPVENSDLPSPLSHGFLPPTQDKVSLPKWIGSADYLRYLNGDCESEPKSVTLYEADRKIGIGIDAATGTVNEGALYQAEYLSLGEDVSMAFTAEMANGLDVLSQPGAPDKLKFGGQGGLGLLDKSKGWRLPKVEISTRYLRWTLITPAIFNAGWRPGWVAGDGKVKLPRPCDPRRPGEGRQAWRERLSKAGSIDATLVAARIGKPEAFSGWRVGGDERSTKAVQAPKPTVLAVPAGSCYVFDCGSAEEAQQLAAVLMPPNRKSDLCGEQGFGVGVCSSINVK